MHLTSCGSPAAAVTSLQLNSLRLGRRRVQPLLRRDSLTGIDQALQIEMIAIAGQVLE
jgi:hypothetical protein